ncbi:uncharacterized protein LOC115999349 [Ipomoea triloba]|uniref:uncharacterized protein LOC115999349 n=1 Tax=Ipomoea triloba TaxID=35885 RepID=UPI00125E22A9|nr:uncharacterized protein LOC115999349 [Ipomoea triloba]
MAKAYDRMECPFFSSNWVNLVMRCVTTVSYNILINGSNGGKVVPMRGLRQGDLLSPYLFIICAERLSLLLQEAQTTANAQEVDVVKQCLHTYESLSGQVVNFHKSNICFSKNTIGDTWDLVAGILGVEKACNFGRYLGLPSFIGRNKRAVFSYVEDKIKQRVGVWNKKLLTKAGKEVLLKSVA